MKTCIALLILFISGHILCAQQGTIKGTVVNKINNEPVAFANVTVQGMPVGDEANEFGEYEIDDLDPGQYNVQVSFIGFEPVTIYEIQVTESRPTYVHVKLEEFAQNLDEVVVAANNTFIKNDESPLSLRTIGSTEIKRTPGANRDISKVVRSFPGVASTPTFRNDLIIRGGSPMENSFYIDGIQIPVINHFQTQGGSGGPMGMLNVDLIQEVSFYSGAFPSNRGNTLSSVFDFQLREGRSDRWGMNATLGASDFGVTFEGPVSENSSLIFSARRSYLKFLFDIFNMPYLPIYNDAQFKYKIKLNEKNQITLLGVGAIDEFQLNFDSPEKARTEEDRRQAQYMINIVPLSDQWNYTVGARYDHFRANGTTALIAGFNTLNNRSIKYFGNNDSDPGNLLQRYNSRESELRVRLEDNTTQGTVRLNYGVAYEHGKYDTDDFTRIVTPYGTAVRDFTSIVNINKWGFFAQVTNQFFERLTLSLGLRADANDYSKQMSNMLEQLSPRFSASYALTSATNLNFNTGIYYQLPSYTVLGYRATSDDKLVNKDNGIRYMRSKHLVSGVEFNLPKNSRITVEGFYKWYDQYPYLVEKQVSLANFGADYGVVGSAPVTSTSEGRSYGIEFLHQQKLYNGFYGLLSYTWVRSEFKDRNQNYVPSSWDSRHLVSLTGGKRFGKNWELGVRWLFTGGSPYTPYDIGATTRRENWDIRPYGIPDYAQLNTKRIRSFHQLDIRVDKKYYFEKWSLNVYFDLQNAYNYVTRFQDDIDVQRDQDGQPVVDPNNTDYYLPDFIPNTAGTILPTFGVVFEL